MTTESTHRFTVRHDDDFAEKIAQFELNADGFWIERAGAPMTQLSQADYLALLDYLKLVGPKAFPSLPAEEAPVEPGKAPPRDERVNEPSPAPIDFEKEYVRCYGLSENMTFSYSNGVFLACYGGAVQPLRVKALDDFRAWLAGISAWMKEEAGE